MRIVAAEIPNHRDHLAIALAIALAVALLGAFLVVMQPRSPDRVPFLERARTIRVLALAEGARRRAVDPVAVDDLQIAVPEDTVPSRVPAFLCRTPDREAVRAWFHERVAPVLAACANGTEGSARSSLTVSFDAMGVVERAHVDGVSDRFHACASDGLALLAYPDAFELTLTWPFVVAR